MRFALPAGLATEGPCLPCSRFRETAPPIIPMCIAPMKPLLPASSPSCSRAPPCSHEAPPPSAYMLRPTRQPLCPRSPTPQTSWTSPPIVPYAHGSHEAVLPDDTPMHIAPMRPLLPPFLCPRSPTPPISWTSPTRARCWRPRCATSRASQVGRWLFWGWAGDAESGRTCAAIRLLLAALPLVVRTSGGPTCSVQGLACGC